LEVTNLVACMRGAQVAMCNAHTPVRRLEDLIPVIQDWNAEIILIEVYICIYILYSMKI